MVFAFFSVFAFDGGRPFLRILWCLRFAAGGRFLWRFAVVGGRACDEGAFFAAVFAFFAVFAFCGGQFGVSQFKVPTLGSPLLLEKPYTPTIQFNEETTKLYLLNLEVLTTKLIIPLIYLEPIQLSRKPVF